MTPGNQFSNLNLRLQIRPPTRPLQPCLRANHWQVTPRNPADGRTPQPKPHWSDHSPWSSRYPVTNAVFSQFFEKLVVARIPSLARFSSLEILVFRSLQIPLFR